MEQHTITLYTWRVAMTMSTSLTIKMLHSILELSAVLLCYAKLLHVVMLFMYSYCISSKSRRTSKSCRFRNVATSICQLVPINTALEILLHGKGSTAISVCARTFYVHTTRLIIEAVYVRACRSL